MNDDFFALLILFVVGALGLWIGSMLGSVSADHDMKQQAVDAGKAQWVIDQKTAQRSFVWKP